MEIQQLRHSLKVKWLLYYRRHRAWLVQLQIWGTYDGQRRPASSFILASLSNLEPQLIEMIPFIIALSSDPDRIVSALGLNFNPETELKTLTEATTEIKTNSNGNNLAETDFGVSSNGNGVAETNFGATSNDNGVGETSLVTTSNGNGTMPLQSLPRDMEEVTPLPAQPVSSLPAWIDQSCHGVGWNRSK